MKPACFSKMLNFHETTQSVTSLHSEPELRLCPQTMAHNLLSIEFQQNQKINSTVILGNGMQFLLPTNTVKLVQGRM
jgi:hypothetical protein